MKWKFEQEFRAAHPETIGETDKEYDLNNYREWLEKLLANCNLQGVNKIPSPDDLGKVCFGCGTFFTEDDAIFDRNGSDNCPKCGMINGGCFDKKRGSR